MKRFLFSLALWMLMCLIWPVGPTYGQRVKLQIGIDFFDSTLSANGQTISSTSIDTTLNSLQTVMSIPLLHYAEWDSIFLEVVSATGDTANYLPSFQLGHGLFTGVISNNSELKHLIWEAKTPFSAAGDTIRTLSANVTKTWNLKDKIGNDKAGWLRIILQGGPWAGTPGIVNSNATNGGAGRIPKRWFILTAVKN